MKSSALDTSPYVAATLKKTKFLETIKIWSSIAFDIIKVLFLSIPNHCIDFYRLLVPLPEKSISGQLALITGGGNGMGRAIAVAMAKVGCNVVIADIDLKAAEKTAADIKKYNVMSKAYGVDVMDSKAITDLHSAIVKDFGPVDILVNNAAILPKMSIDDGTDDDICRIINVNLTAHFYTIRTFLPDMIKNKRGHIVGISSIGALYPLPKGVAYTATKYGVNGLMLSLAEEFRHCNQRKHINISTVLPYFVATRKTLMDSVCLRVPPFHPKEAASIILDGILRNKLEIVFPKYIYYFLTLLNIGSYTNCRLYRDYVFKDSSSINN